MELLWYIKNIIIFILCARILGCMGLGLRRILFRVVLPPCRRTTTITMLIGNLYVAVSLCEAIIVSFVTLWSFVDDQWLKRVDWLPAMTLTKFLEVNIKRIGNPITDFIQSYWWELFQNNDKIMWRFCDCNFFDCLSLFIALFTFVSILQFFRLEIILDTFLKGVSCEVKNQV